MAKVSGEKPGNMVTVPVPLRPPWLLRIVTTYILALANLKARCAPVIRHCEFQRKSHLGEPFADALM
jgi:hypothetical protein